MYVDGNTTFAARWGLAAAAAAQQGSEYAADDLPSYGAPQRPGGALGHRLG